MCLFCRMDLSTLIDESYSYAFRVLIEARLSLKSGFNMLVGSQPDFLSPDEYKHTEMEENNKIAITFLHNTEGACSRMLPGVYSMHLGEYSTTKSVHMAIDKEINLFVEYLTTNHFNKDALNRFAFRSLTISKDHTLDINYYLDTKPLFKLDNRRTIVAIVMNYGPEVWAIRSQRVTENQ